jgi:uncharacterized protein
MRLDLTQFIRSEGMKKEFNYLLDLADFELLGINPFSNGVKVAGIVFNIGGALVMKASADAMFHSFCDRCQKEFSMPLSVEFESNIALEETEETGDDTIIVNSGMLDIDEVVRDHLILSIPTKLLCNEDCKGLCFHCGADLNENSCSCVKESIDPRLAALKDFI